MRVHIKDVHEIKSVPKFMLQFNSKISKKEIIEKQNFKMEMKNVN